MLFLKNLSKELTMDISDLMVFFIFLKKKYPNEIIFNLLKKNNYNITKLDIQRLYRFVNVCY